MAQIGDISNNVKSWYNQEIYQWRLWGCVATLCPVLGTFLTFVIFLLRADIWHPLQWIQSWFLSFFSLSTYLCVFVISFLTIVLVICNSYTYSVVPKYFLSKSDIILELIQPLNIALIVCYAAIGAFTVRLYLWVEGGEFSTLVISCNGESSAKCLNDHHLFIVFHGAFVAFLYAFGVIVKNYNCVNLPVVSQRRFVQIKGSVMSGMRHSLAVVLKQLKWYLFVYAIWGTSLCAWVISVLHVTSRNMTTWGMLISLFNMKLWWFTIITGSAIYFMFHTVTTLFNIFQIQRIVFPLHTALDAESSRTLSLAISCKDCSLVRFLGFLDLSILAYQSPRRRQDIFHISHPGGHPIYWNVIVNECLDLLKSLLNTLTLRFDPDSAGTTRITEEPVNRLYENIPSKIYHDSPFNVEKFRQNPTANLPPIVSPLVSVTTAVTNGVSKKFAVGWQALQNLSILAFFIKELPLAVANKIFAECQLHIWAVESLSFLVSTSITEDKYGVVQRDLANIIGTMIDLQKAVNQVLRNEMGPSRRSFINPLAISLQTSLKMGLCRILYTFEDYISSIGLSPENYQYLLRYKEFEDYQ